MGKYISSMKKKGVSPVIATVLLIAMVVVLALIIFMWFRSLSQEKIMKFDQNIELVCPDVSFSVQSGTSLIIENTGDVSLFSLKVRGTSRDYETGDISSITDDEWPAYGLNPGEIFEYVGADLPEEALFIPVLAGTSEEGGRSYVCDERWGVEL